MTTLAENLEQRRSEPGRARQHHKHVPWRSLSTSVHRRDVDGPTLISLMEMDTRTYWRRVAGRGVDAVYEMQEGVPNDL